MNSRTCPILLWSSARPADWRCTPAWARPIRGATYLNAAEASVGCGRGEAQSFNLVGCRPWIDPGPPKRSGPSPRITCLHGGPPLPHSRYEVNFSHPWSAFATRWNVRIAVSTTPPQGMGGGAMADSVSVSALVVALIGAVSGITAAFLAARAQQRVVRLTASLGEQRAESDARRSYEYEARKRLYRVYEPLRVRLLDCTDNAVRQIVDLVGRPGPGRPGYSSAEYRLNATIYYLLAPLVVSRTIERRLTLVDLGLDARIHTEFMLAQAICRSLANEFQGARVGPWLRYPPSVQGWGEKRGESPQRFRRQGLPLGRLNTALDELLVTRPEGVETLTTFGEFEPLQTALDDEDGRSGPGAARDRVFEFDPVH